MAPDSFTEVTRTGLGSRMMNSVKGIIVGIILFFGSFVLLWWNEGNLVAEKAALSEVLENVVEADPAKSNPALNDKLVHLTAELGSSEKIGDGEFLKPGPWLKVSRIVEMYQWVEKSESKTEKKLGGSEETTTTYTYEKKWAKNRVDSSDFKHQEGHQNPELTVRPSEYKVSSTTFGGYDGKTVLEQISAETEISLTDSMFQAGRGKLEGGKVYIRKVPGASDPQVGDVRISFQVLNPGKFSIIAQQMGGTDFAYYVAKNGKEKFLVGEGVKSSKQLVETAVAQSSALAWILRAVGFFMMWFGMALVFGPISTLLDIVPFLGSLGRGAIGLLTGVIALILSVVTIVIAMIAHNVIALAITLALTAFGIYKWLKKKNAAVAPAPVAATANSTQSLFGK